MKALKRKSGTWALEKENIDPFIGEIKALEDKYWNLIGDDSVYDGLDAAIRRLKSLKSISGRKQALKRKSNVKALKRKSDTRELSKRHAPAFADAINLTKEKFSYYVDDDEVNQYLDNAIGRLKELEEQNVH